MATRKGRAYGEVTGSPTPPLKGDGQLVTLQVDGVSLAVDGQSLLKRHSREQAESPPFLAWLTLRGASAYVHPWGDDPGGGIPPLMPRNV